MKIQKILTCVVSYLVWWIYSQGFAQLNVHNQWIEKFNDSTSFQNLKLVEDLVKKSVFFENSQLSEHSNKYYLMSQSILKNPELVTEKDFAHLLALAYFIKKTIPFHIQKNENSMYILPDNDFIKFPIQIYKNGDMYIHFNDKDKLYKKGGYKHFARSISINDDSLVANLEAHCDNKKNLKSFLFELGLMEEFLNKRRILSFLNYDFIGDSPSKIVFQAPLYEGDLTHFREMNQRLSVYVYISLKSAKALKSFHKMHWIHRDVKLGNLFYMNKSPDRYRIVLADFGLSQFEQNQNFGISLSGTRGYMAPEICENRMAHGYSFQTFQQGEKADIFSLGMTFFSLLNGRKTTMREAVHQINKIALPPKGEEKGNWDDLQKSLIKFDLIYQNALKEKFVSPLYASYHMLILKMIHPDPSQRPSLNDIISDLQTLKKM